jgi:transcriptional regulator with XRE-family HTH domain
VEGLKVNVPSKNKPKRERPPHPRNITGTRIKEIRRSLKPRVSQDNLSGRVAAVGFTLTRTQVAKIESGLRPVTDYEVFAIAKALRVSVETLFPSSLRR